MIRGSQESLINAGLGEKDAIVSTRMASWYTSYRWAWVILIISICIGLVITLAILLGIFSSQTDRKCESGNAAIGTGMNIGQLARLS